MLGGRWPRPLDALRPWTDRPIRLLPTDATVTRRDRRQRAEASAPATAEAGPREPGRQLPRRIARVCDGLLDFLLLAFAAWTVIYHVCLVLHVDAVWAAAAAAAALVPCAWLFARRSGPELRTAAQADARAGWLRRLTPARFVNVGAATGAAILFAFTDAPWRAVWLLWLAAAGAAIITTIVRESGRHGWDANEAPAEGRWTAWPETLTAFTWAVGLGTLSLFLVGPDVDDTQYVHLSSWVADHGEFPLRDTLFSDEVFPAIIFPPLSSFEALAGTVARVTGLSTPDLLYLVVTPLASVLSVLALWRLLRAWAVPMVGVALSVALAFLLMDAEGHRTLGNLFVARMWQGKIIFLAVLLPILFALLTEYVQRPARRRLPLLTAAGVAGVGLTTTAIFVVPVVAAGCLAPLAVRSWRKAAEGLLASSTYPLGAGVVSVAVGGRTAEEYTDSDMVPGRLVHFVLGDGLLALVAVAAVLIGPVLLRRASAAQSTSATVLLVGCLFAPLVPLLVFNLTGLGQVLWRWTWALPTAALVGVLATGLAGSRTPAVRLAPAVLLCAAFAAWGTPVWSAAGETTVASEPAWKRPPRSIEAARTILAEARAGDVILAPRAVSQTILVMSGEVTTVDPRVSYTRALRGVAGAHARERLLLGLFAQHGLGPVRGSERRIVEASEVARALDVVGADVACVTTGDPEARRLLLASGYMPSGGGGGVTCLRSPDPSRSSG
jgi:hypothetical protein